VLSSMVTNSDVDSGRQYQYQQQGGWNDKNNEHHEARGMEASNFQTLQYFQLFGLAAS
jgi:hypothetical protein